MSTPPLAPKPTRVRYSVIAVMAFAAFLMYIDRMCLSQMVSADTFQHDLQLDKGAVSTVLGVFFFAYALGQMPAAWFGDRFGARSLLTWLIALWSAFTLLTGCAVGLWSLLLARVGCGLAEAGAYSCSGSLVPRWVPLQERGRANAIIAGGGRVGGAVAPFLSAIVIGWLGTWRTPGWVYGATGLLFAGIYWWVARDRPSEHPRVNDAERALIERDLPEELRGPARPTAKIRTPWAGLLCSRDMWLMCLFQFLTNAGWVFLVTYMPTFLRETKGLDEKTAGFMATMALFVGCVGMLAGGWLTDVLTRRLGIRLGRMIPMAYSRIAGAAAYLVCLGFDSPWIAVAAFGIVAAMTDISIPAAWGYIQDVGGRNIASAYAWPNMWGNFGAALTPPLLTWINKRFDSQHNWHASLVFLAAAFLLSGVAAFWMRADVKIAAAEEVATDDV